MMKLLLWLLAASTATCAKTGLRGEQAPQSRRELAVDKLRLINANNNSPILDLTDNAVLSASTLPSNLNIEAVLSTPETVTFGFDGNA